MSISISSGGADQSGGADAAQQAEEAARAAEQQRQIEAARQAAEAARAAAAAEAAKLKEKAGVDGKSSFDPNAAAAGAAAAEGFTGKLKVEFESEGKTHEAEMTAIQGKLYFEGQEVGSVGAKKADGQLEVTVFGQQSAGAAQAVDAPPPQPRLTDVLPLEGGPRLTPADLTSLSGKVDTIVSVVPQAEQAKVREFLEKKADVGSINAAFDQVLQAAHDPGSKALSLKLQSPSFQETHEHRNFSTSSQRALETLEVKAQLEVGADFKVNGQALPCDKELEAGARVAHLSDASKRDALRQVGVSEDWLSGASGSEVQQALSQVEVARQTPGSKTLDLGRETRAVEERYVEDTSSWHGRDGGSSTLVREVKATRVEARVALEVGAQGEVNGQPSKADTALAALVKRETSAWPNGAPESYIKTKCAGSTLTPASLAEGTTRQGKIDTINAVLPESARAEFTKLLATGGERPAAATGGWNREKVLSGGISDEQLDQTFRAVLEARNTPGQKTLSLEVTPFHQVESTSRFGRESNTTVAAVDAPKVKFSLSLDVSANGNVNGQPLPADLHARLSTELSKVPPEFKEQTLKQAGLSDDWVRSASPLEKDFALAKLREATMSPGVKTLELGFTHSETHYVHDDGPRTVSRQVEGQLKLDVAADGKVNGKALIIETALATTLVMDKLSMADKRAMMASLGFDAGAQRDVSPQQGTTLLTKAALATQVQGEHQLEVYVGGGRYQLGLLVGENGKLEGAGATFLPDPPSRSWFEKALGPVLTILSILPTPLAPFAQIANGVLSVAQGIKNNNILGVISGALGVGGNIAGFLGNASLATTLTSAASLANAANGVVTAVKTGDVAGLIGAAVAAANSYGTLAGTPVTSELMGYDLKTLGQAAKAVGGVATAIQKNDIGALVTAGLEGADAVDKLTGKTLLDPGQRQTITNVGELAKAVQAGEKALKGDFAGLITAVIDGTGAVEKLTGTTILDPGQRTTLGEVRDVAGAVQGVQKAITEKNIDALLGALNVGADAAGKLTGTTLLDKEQRATLQEIGGVAKAVQAGQLAINKQDFNALLGALNTGADSLDKLTGATLLDKGQRETLQQAASLATAVQAAQKAFAGKDVDALLKAVTDGNGAAGALTGTTVLDKGQLQTLGELAGVTKAVQAAQAALAGKNIDALLTAVTSGAAAASALTGTTLLDKAQLQTLKEVGEVGKALQNVSAAVDKRDFTALFGAITKGADAAGQLTGTTILTPGEKKALTDIGQLATTAVSAQKALTEKKPIDFMTSVMGWADAAGSLTGTTFLTEGDKKTLTQLGVLGVAVQDGQKSAKEKDVAGFLKAVMAGADATGAITGTTLLSAEEKKTLTKFGELATTAKAADAAWEKKDLNAFLQSVITGTDVVGSLTTGKNMLTEGEKKTLLNVGTLATATQQADAALARRDPSAFFKAVITGATSGAQLAGTPLSDSVQGSLSMLGQLVDFGAAYQGGDNAAAVAGLVTMMQQNAP